MNKTKTNHQTGYHKPVVNPTTNYPKDSHKELSASAAWRDTTKAFALSRTARILPVGVISDGG
jgi:hypothetical protein